MSNKKHISLAVLILLLVELVYFGLIMGVTSLFSISLSIAIVQVIGVLIAVGYVLIINPFFREYKKNMNYRVSKIEQEQRKLDRRVANLEKIQKTPIKDV